MPSPTVFLAPHPPILFHVAESQAFSSSSASLSSTSSATSAFFDRLSRASAASAYLTDLTPPITPSHSNFDVEQRLGGQQLKSSELKDDPAVQQSTPKDSRHNLIRTILASDEGYRSDQELEEGGFNAVDVLRERLRRPKQTLNSRRALKIMERRDGAPIRDGDPQRVGTAPLPMKVVITEAREDPSEDWSGDFELNLQKDLQAKSHTSPDVEDSQWDDRSLIDGSITDTGLTRPHVASEVDSNDSVHEPFLERDIVHSNENFVFSPVLPPKPAIMPMDLDWECSPFSLCSPALSLPDSISRILESPLQLDATGTISSPAIYNSSVIGCHSPFNSPLLAISNFMFSSRIRRMSEGFTGEDLAVADLMRLEISATQVQAESTPVTQASGDARPIVGLGFEMPSPTSQFPLGVFQPLQHEARGSLSPFPPSRSETPIDFENISIPSDYGQLSEIPLEEIPLDTSLYDFVVDGANAELLAPASDEENVLLELVEEKIISNERSDNSGREFVGLGLGGLAGGSLQSSGSISRLYLVPSPSCGKLSSERAMKDSSLDNMFNGGYYSPGIEERSEDIIPAFALMESVNTSDFNLDHMSVSPIQTESPLPPSHESIADELSNHNVYARKRPEIEQPHALLEEKRRRGVPPLHVGLGGVKSLALPTRYSSVYIGRSPTESSPMLLTPENDPRSPYSPAEDYFSGGQENRGQNAEGGNSEDHEPLVSGPSYVVPEYENSEDCAAEGLGMGLSDLANQQNGHECMSSAQGCMDLAQLAGASSPHGQRERLETNTSFEAPKDSIRSTLFTKRRLYDIPEFPSPPFVHETRPPTPTPSSSSRLLSPAWPNLGLFDRLTPSKSTHSGIKSGSTSRASGSAASTSTRENDRLGLPVDIDPCPPLQVNISTSPLPPTPPAHKIRFPWMSRSPLSGSSVSISNSSSSPVERCSTSGVISPTVVERTDVRGLGLFKRNNSSPSPKAGRKEGRFKPAIRRLQLLF